MAERVLVVDDEKSIRKVVEYALTEGGFEVLSAGRGDDALEIIEKEPVDLVVLDLMLPGLDGIEVCRRIRATRNVPIIMLSARDDEVDKVLGLEMGADDYVTKPFSPREVVARVAAILRRYGAPARDDTRSHGAITLDREARLCRAAGQPVALTGTEFQMLDTLIAAPGRLFTRAELASAVWGAGAQQSDRTMDSHLRNLRRKLADAGVPDAIETVHAQGMRLGPCTADAA
ncbi:response regulator [Sagittula sp.]|uniref:response regulator n=1 Tax=Sagittula sp. TaxID=2038081 RepID=UPI003513268A